MKRALILIVLLCTLSCAMRKKPIEPAPVPQVDAEAAFSELKSLAGNWSGTVDHGGKTERTTVQYRLTSGGSALVETLMAGTPHEMESIMYPVDGALVFTHYCMLGNQPRMKLEHVVGNHYEFNFTGGDNLHSPTDAFMHNMSLTLVGPNELIEEWTFYNMGKQEGTTTLRLKRAALSKVVQKKVLSKKNIRASKPKKS